MTEPLAREKVEQACGRLQDLYPHLKNIQLILNIDAALRRRLAEMTAELDVLTIIVRDNRMTNLRQELAALRQQLAEKDRTIRAVEAEVADLTTWLEIARDACNAWNRYAEALTAKLAVCQKQLAEAQNAKVKL